MRHHEPTSALEHHLAGQARITVLEAALVEAAGDIRSVSAMARTAAEQTRSSIQAALRHLADGGQDEAVDILRGAVADLEVGIASMGAVH